MKKILSLFLVLFAVLIAGCGGGGSGSGSNAKKEVQSLKQKYAEQTELLFLEQTKVAHTVKDWSQDLVKISDEAKQKFEANIKSIDNEKVSKQAEPYKNALKERNSLYVKLFDLAGKQVRSKLDNKPNSEIKELGKQADEVDSLLEQSTYDIENEYSKIVVGKPATVMGVNGVNYLAFTASNVDMAVIKARWQKDAIGSNPYLQKKPLGKFIIIDVFIKNNQKDAITVNGSSFKLVDNQKREFSTSHEAELALRADKGDSAKGFLTQLNPGMGTDFTFVFDVPDEINRYNTKLVARGGFAGDKVELFSFPVKVKQIKQ